MTIEFVKLINNKNGSIIERRKVDYENNVKIWTQRGWSLHNEKSVKSKIEKPIKKIIDKVVKPKKKKNFKKPKKKT